MMYYIHRKNKIVIYIGDDVWNFSISSISKKEIIRITYWCLSNDKESLNIQSLPPPLICHSKNSNSLQLTRSCYVQKFEYVMTSITIKLNSNRRMDENHFSLPVLSLHIADPSTSLVCVVVEFAPSDLVTLLYSLLHEWIASIRTSPGIVRIMIFSI